MSDIMSRRSVPAHLVRRRFSPSNSHQRVDSHHQRSSPTVSNSSRIPIHVSQPQLMNVAESPDDDDDEVKVVEAEFWNELDREFKAWYAECGISKGQQDSKTQPLLSAGQLSNPAQKKMRYFTHPNSYEKVDCHRQYCVRYQADRAAMTDQTDEKYELRRQYRDARDSLPHCVAMKTQTQPLLKLNLESICDHLAPHWRLSSFFDANVVDEAERQRRAQLERDEERRCQQEVQAELLQKEELKRHKEARYREVQQQLLDMKQDAAIGAHMSRSLRVQDDPVEMFEQKQQHQATSHHSPKQL